MFLLKKLARTGSVISCLHRSRQWAASPPALLRFGLRSLTSTTVLFRILAFPDIRTLCIYSRASTDATADFRMRCLRLVTGTSINAMACEFLEREIPSDPNYPVGELVLSILGGQVAIGVCWRGLCILPYFTHMLPGCFVGLLGFRPRVLQSSSPILH